MKKTLKSIALSLVAIAAAALAVPASAQEQSGAEGLKERHAMSGMHEMRAKIHFSEVLGLLKLDLGLSDAQVAKIHPMVMKFEQQIAQLKGEGHGQDMEALHKDLMSQVQSTLTPAQSEQFKSFPSRMGLLRFTGLPLEGLLHVGLTKSQYDKLVGIAQATRTSALGNGEEGENARIKLDAINNARSQSLAVLTPAQRALLESKGDKPQR